MNPVPLYERHRPQTLDEVVGQPVAVAKIRRFIESESVAGRAFWISGRSGNGKTTLARIIAHSLAEPDWVEEIDATDLTLPKLREIRQRHRFIPLLGHGHAVIVNEAHASKDATRLLGALEPIPPRVVWVFTTTLAGQAKFSGMEDSNALLSRCVPIKLQTKGVGEAFAARALEIARNECLDGRPLSAYKELVNQSRANMRTVLQAIEAGDMLKS